MSQCLWVHWSNNVLHHTKPLSINMYVSVYGAWCSLMVQWVKNLPEMLELLEMWVQPLGKEDPLEKKMATHSLFLPEKPQGQRNLVGCESEPTPMKTLVTQLLCPWNSQGENSGVGSHSLLQGIFLTQGSNPGLLHCRQILYCLSHPGSPCIYMFCAVSSCFSCVWLLPERRRHAWRDARRNAWGLPWWWSSSIRCLTVWTVAHQFMGFSSQKYWSGLLCPPPGDLPDPGVGLMSLMSPALADRFFTTSATCEAYIYTNISLNLLINVSCYIFHYPFTLIYIRILKFLVENVVGSFFWITESLLIDVCRQVTFKVII